jgi:hypothetical protein
MIFRKYGLKLNCASGGPIPEAIGDESITVGERVLIRINDSSCICVKIENGIALVEVSSVGDAADNWDVDVKSVQSAPSLPPSNTITIDEPSIVAMPAPLSPLRVIAEEPRAVGSDTSSCGSTVVELDAAPSGRPPRSDREFVGENDFGSYSEKTFEVLGVDGVLCLVKGKDDRLPTVVRKSRGKRTNFKFSSVADYDSFFVHESLKDSENAILVFLNHAISRLRVGHAGTMSNKLVSSA